MIIRDMFRYDINRKIDGVVKADQDDQSVICREVKEYVITEELKKHFASFFKTYAESFSEPTSDIGVWISGFYGSGKSHFLKILSHLLRNKEIDGIKTSEYFREKLSGDPAIFDRIAEATQCETETILFNIDIEGSVKENAAVLRVFAKMFYSHLGFCGDNLKAVMLEQYIERCGKTEEFRRVFEEIKGKPWIEQRKAFAFNGEPIAAATAKVLGISQEDAKKWLADESSDDFSIARLTEDIKAYIAGKPKNFRLLFMADEAGQYVGNDKERLLNLQSLTEKIGAECGGSVWVICTGQEGIDQIAKEQEDGFSRIRARFKTRLSLTSSSSAEVIQKRLLTKTPEAAAELANRFKKYETVLLNLFSFADCAPEIRGYGGSSEFVATYPFAPYQFAVMQSVFKEIRKRGAAGKHFSDAERSMLTAFREAAQKVQDRGDYAIVPLFQFFDAAHAFSDESARRITERCQKDADAGAGLEQCDADTLKLLYFLRYADGIKPTLGNIVILMADDIRADKIAMRESAEKSLMRLQKRNYIARSGDVYRFLAAEEQDIEREIRNTPIDAPSVSARIAEIIFGDIYASKKIRCGKCSFSFGRAVDGIFCGAPADGLTLQFLSAASDAGRKTKTEMKRASAGQALAALAGADYCEPLEYSMKIRRYANRRNLSLLPPATQKILRSRLDEAAQCEEAATNALRKSIEDAEFYADGEELCRITGDAKKKIGQALEYLATHVYSALGKIDCYAETDGDIADILTATGQINAEGAKPNREAAADVESFLELQDAKHLPVSMADIRTRYRAIPFGWREIDIAATVAALIAEQKITVTCGDRAVLPSDPRLPELLRKKSEIGKTMISLRRSISAKAMKDAREFLRDFFDTMDVPDGEDGLAAFICEKFTAHKAHCEDLLLRCEENNYPGKSAARAAADLDNGVLSQRKNNASLVSAVLKNKDALLACNEDMQNVEAFFKTQVPLFDAATRMLAGLQDEFDYFAPETDARTALARIRTIVAAQDKFDYKRIPELNALMAAVRAEHHRLLSEKRCELRETVGQCREFIKTAAGNNEAALAVCAEADAFFEEKLQRIEALENLAVSDGLIAIFRARKDTACREIAKLLCPAPPKPAIAAASQPAKRIKTCRRDLILPPACLETDADIDAFAETLRTALKSLMRDCDRIELT